MFKIRYVLCLLVPLLFISCEKESLDTDDFHCKLDKEHWQYQKGENITLFYDGRFDDIPDIGSFKIDFHVYNTVDGSPVDIQKLTFPDSSPVSSYYDGEYYVIVKENEKLTDFKDKIVFSISEHGNYSMRIYMRGSTKNHAYYCNRVFGFPITVTE